MSFEDAKQDEINLDEYIHLERQKAKINTVVQEWMDRATALHAIVTADKQAELITMRNSLVNDLRTILGV
jgi:hypothetical protein